MSESIARLRFAPSPTGLLHIGGLRTALYNYLLARQLGGAFVLRIEDTDQKRFVEGAEADIFRSLQWAGISIDEGPQEGGPHGPYRQSERRDVYREHAEMLVAKGAAYYAFDTEEEIELMRARYREAGIESAGYGVRTRGEMRNSLTLPVDEVESLLSQEVPHVVRLKVPAGRTVQLSDLIRGDVSFESDVIDDQVLMKSDGLPTYHLAVVVDDHLMNITHVVRGEDWLSSTPKHLLLYEAFGWTAPKMAHLPLILSPSGGKLSKRNAEKMGIPVTVRQYVEAGYEPDALVNFLALLGWHPADDRELFSMDDLIRAFDINRVGLAGVQFDLDKLNWFNQQHLRSLTDSELASLGRPFVEEKGYEVSDAALESVAALLKERITFARELADVTYLFADPAAFDAKGVKKRWSIEAAERLTWLEAHLSSLSNEQWTASTIHDEAEKALLARDVPLGKVMPVFRLALTGETSGPELFPLIEYLGHDTVVRRLRNAPALIGTSPE
ncbi:MAG: glutamate--tRNA ligase [Rhodothermales bacterium]